MAKNQRIPLTVARRMFGQIIDAVHRGEHIELTEHGHRVAVIIPIDDYTPNTEKNNP